jgi:hypothetical protein
MNKGPKFGNPSALTFFGAGYGFILLALTSFIPENQAIAMAAMWGVLLAGMSLFWAGLWNYLRGESFFGVLATFVGLWAFAIFFYLYHGTPPAPLGLGLIGFGATIPIMIMLAFSIRAKMWVLAATIATLGGVSFWLGMQGLPIAFAEHFKIGTGVSATINFILLWYQGYKAVMAENVPVARTYEDDMETHTVNGGRLSTLRGSPEVAPVDELDH